MAVQAQYPSKLIFLDPGESDRKEMDLPRPLPAPAPKSLAGVSPAVVSNGVGRNGRKRAREAAVSTVPALPPPPKGKEFIDLFALQPQPQRQPAFVGLARLHNNSMSSPSPSPASLVSTGLRLAFEEEQQHKKINSSCCSSPLFASNELTVMMKHHDDKVDAFLREQGDQLRRALAQMQGRHHRALLIAADEAAERRLREKAEEAERAARHGTELEERLASLRTEAAAWQAKAVAQHAAAVALHAQLQQATAAARGSLEDLVVGEAGPAESASSAHVDPRRADPHRACRACRLVTATVVLFPCRHLSLCSKCFAAGDVDAAMACPICHCIRTGSMEAIVS